MYVMYKAIYDMKKLLKHVMWVDFRGSLSGALTREAHCQLRDYRDNYFRKTCAQHNS